jgi:uncharacterized protein YndB with AHSA1/START domain
MTRPRAITDGETLIAVAAIAAPPERVFRALHTKECENWWGAEDVYLTRNFEADLRVGGRWSLDSVFPGEPAHHSTGVFLHIEAPRRVELTRRYEFDFPGLGWRDTIVTYLLSPTAEGSCLLIRHDGFRAAYEAARAHVTGWERFLGWLQAYFSLATTSPRSLLAGETPCPT